VTDTAQSRPESSVVARVMSACLAKCPRCIRCRRPCVAGQTDDAGRPLHLSCRGAEHAAGVTR
jgi:hypothetical protein